MPAALNLLDAADRPRLTDISPGALRQGETRELTISLVGGLEGPPVVDLGEGLIAQDVYVADDGTIRVTATAPSDVAIGERGVRVDDGVRVLTGVDIDVKDVLITPERACATGSGAPGIAWIAAALWVRRRRPLSISRSSGYHAAIPESA